MILCIVQLRNAPLGAGWKLRSAPTSPQFVVLSYFYTKSPTHAIICIGGLCDTWLLSPA
jgi:hypothetical protein